MQPDKITSNTKTAKTPWQRSICRKIVVYVVYSSTSRAIAHALWRIQSNDLNDTLLTGMLNAARLSCFAHYTI